MSPALAHIVHVWENVSTKSWQRFNGALRSALQNAIESGMKFDESDFKTIAKEYRLGRWSGENLEWAYTTACGGERGTDNPSAVQALEKYWGREPFLWAEKTKTPTRLHVGSRFTWQGSFVTVTSFNDKEKSLTACTYKDEWQREYGATPKVGERDHFAGDYRTIEAIKEYADGRIVARFSPKMEKASEARKVERRFTVLASELKGIRADYDKRRRVHEKAIAAARTLEELDAAREAAQADKGKYRHFDIEILTAKVAERKTEIGEEIARENYAKKEPERVAAYVKYLAECEASAEANMVRWLAGEDCADYLYACDVKIRVKGDYVETSNGHRVSVDAARTTLKFIKRHPTWQSNGTTHDVDAFRLERVGPGGIQIGCTFIAADEVKRCAELLKVK